MGHVSTKKIQHLIHKDSIKDRIIHTNKYVLYIAQQWPQYERQEEKHPTTTKLMIITTTTTTTTTTCLKSTI
jgi:hypothetical protein